MRKAAELRRKEKQQAAADRERVRKQIQEDKERRKRAADEAKNVTSAAAVGATSQGAIVGELLDSLNNGTY